MPEHKIIEYLGGAFIGDARQNTPHFIEYLIKGA
jgi:hypothetical protein